MDSFSSDEVIKPPNAARKGLVIVRPNIWRSKEVNIHFYHDLFHID